MTLLLHASGCGDDLNAEGIEAGADGTASLPSVDSSPGPERDAGAKLDTGSQDADAAATINPVSYCPVPPMDQLYTGIIPPNPYGPITAADACINKKHDGIIVLGCPNNADGSAANCQKARADMAVSFRNAGFGDRIITSGAAVHNAYVEADTLKQLLVDRGVPASDIFTETQAAHTDENLYFSTIIMKKQGWTNAIVVSEDPGHLILSATCDSNCCVDLGRLTALQFDVAGTTIKAGHYALFPYAQAVSAAECTAIKFPSKVMCSNLGSRLACAGNIKVDGGQ